jgi:hypothetical protein
MTSRGDQNAAVLLTVEAAAERLSTSPRFIRRLSDGRFYFESLNPRAVPVVDPVSDVLEAVARAEVDQEPGAESEAPDDDYDARFRIYRQIVSRQGQAGFRAALLEAYGGQCAVTGFDAAPALEGAHLRPYRGPASNDVTNGLLLRADIHTPFDLGLLAPDPVTRTIVVSKLLAGSQYAALTGSQLADPALARQRPNQEALETVWQRFREAEDGRLCQMTTDLAMVFKSICGPRPGGAATCVVGTRGWPARQDHPAYIPRILRPVRALTSVSTSREAPVSDW